MQQCSRGNCWISDPEHKLMILKPSFTLPTTFSSSTGVNLCNMSFMLRVSGGSDARLCKATCVAEDLETPRFASLETRIASLLVLGAVSETWLASGAARFKGLLAFLAMTTKASKPRRAFEMLNAWATLCRDGQQWTHAHENHNNMKEEQTFVHACSSIMANMSPSQ